MRVLAISGSLRAQSHNTGLLREAARLAPDGVTVELYEGLEDLPPYNEDRDTETPPREVMRLRDQIAAADALLISTPEYNGTVPGQLKHAVDWASRPYGRSAALWGKPIAVVGASTSDYGAMWAQDHLRKALGIAGGRVLEAGLAVGRAAERFDSRGHLNDPETAERLQELVEEIVEHHQTLALAA
jgi:chromate reductase, NAD(P)H dehydrogenase (quinone)